MKLSKDLREFVELLNASGVKYLLIGGYAVAFHGHPRFTGDIDFFVEPTLENGGKLVRVFADFGFGDLGLRAEDFTEPDAIIQLGRPPNRIDILSSIDGVLFDAAWATKINGVLDGLTVRVIGKEMLLQNKRATDRPQDAADVAALS